MNKANKGLVIAIIPARGGSKGLPGKNIKPLNGKPLIQHTISLAKSCNKIDRVIVSTDDMAIASVAEHCGAEVIMRPPELAADHSLVIDAIKHVVDVLESRGDQVNSILLLEATSPLREKQAVEECLDALEKPGVNSVATFCETKVSPHRIWKFANNRAVTFIDGAIPWLPRQKQPVGYELNGHVYAFSRSNLSRENAVSFLTDDIVPVLTPQELSIDIDTEFDFLMVEKILQGQKNEKSK